MIQEEFANRAKEILQEDDEVIGLAVGGSWLTKDVDEYSDLDLILVSKSKISSDKKKMFTYAKRLGNLLSAFTGEHVGEPRLLICLYDNPFLHVDIKFVTLKDINPRVETPYLLFDKDGQVRNELDKSESKFPLPNYQWIEDRFWTWVHYALLKIGRGEYLEALDFFGFLRMVVIGPLLHIKNGNLPRAMRRVESELTPEDFADLKKTIPDYDRQSLLNSLRNSVGLYRSLRENLFGEEIEMRFQAEERVMKYFETIEKSK